MEGWKKGERRGRRKPPCCASHLACACLVGKLDMQSLTHSSASCFMSYFLFSLEQLLLYSFFLVSSFWKDTNIHAWLSSLSPHRDLLRLTKRTAEGKAPPPPARPPPALNASLTSSQILCVCALQNKNLQRGLSLGTQRNREKDLTKELGHKRDREREL